MKKLDGMIISIIGLGFVVGALTSVMGFATTILLSVGLGFMLGGVFKEINLIKKKIDKQHRIIAS